MWVPRGKCGNIQSGRGVRVSTIGLLGCSTSVALATGPTDEEEEDQCFKQNHISLPSHIYVTSPQIYSNDQGSPWLYRAVVRTVWSL